MLSGVKQKQELCEKSGHAYKYVSRRKEIIEKDILAFVKGELIIEQRIKDAKGRKSY